MFKNKFLILIAVVIVAGVAWFFLSGSGAPAPDLTTVSSATDTSAADQQLVSTLLSLQAVSLNGTIFSNPAFQSLQDFSVQIVPEPEGRPDPFAPLSDTAAVSASTTKSAQIFKPQQ